MKKKITWLMVSCLMVTALVLASCAPAEVEEEEVVVTPEEEEVVVAEEEVVVAEEKEMVRDALGRLVEKPQYGGDFVRAGASDVLGFDDCLMTEWFTVTMNVTNDELLTGDWTKSTTGSNENSWRAPAVFLPQMEVGCLAESWEFPDAETAIYRLRKGVRFHNKPPVNGRELTADDVVFSINRHYETGGNYINAVVPPEDRPTVTALDKYTVMVKAPPGLSRDGFWHIVSDLTRIVPRDMVEEYGDLKDWRNACGTGPFLLVDYVPMSSLTFIRNPDYWRKNPLHPEDTLPYIDSMKWLVIPDASTRMSAMRTGKIDLLGVGWEDAGDLLETNPELGYYRYLSATSSNIYLRMDKPELPWHDIRVRQALHMAIDLQAIADDYYGGNAEILTHPVVPYAEFMDLVYPFEDLPESTRELFRYNPEKAKQLLAEAGYPVGFQASIVCTSGYVDLLSIVKDYWVHIGVDLELDVKETAVHESIRMRKKQEEMIIAYMDNAQFQTGTYFNTGAALNASQISDERMDLLVEELGEKKYDWDWLVQQWQEVTPYILEQAWSIELPTPYSFVTWWPWVKEYSGESTIGYLNFYNYAVYLWLDQDLKKEMGY